MGMKTEILFHSMEWNIYTVPSAVMIHIICKRATNTTCGSDTNIEFLLQDSGLK